MSRRTSKAAWAALGLVLMGAAVGIVLYAGEWMETRRHTDAIERATAAEEARRRETPEELVRNLMLAIARRDEQGILMRVQPHPDAHMLWEPSSLNDRPEAIELFQSLPVTRLKPGDPLPDPFTPGQRVTTEMVNAEHLVLCLHTKGDDAWTFFVVRRADEWRVDMNWYLELMKRTRQHSSPTTRTRDGA